VIFALLGASVAFGAGIDLLEVGGPWGSPGVGGPAAVWYNPGAIASEDGTRLTFELAPASGYVQFDRDDPVNGGMDVLRGAGLVPFLGATTQLGGTGLSAGFAVFAPYGRTGASDRPNGSARYAVRRGSVTNLFSSGALALELPGGISVGAAGHFIVARYAATTDKEILTALDTELCARGYCDLYTDADIEDPDYGATIDLKLLSVSATGALGLHVQPGKRFALGLSWVAGTTVSPWGPASLRFGCPPQQDVQGRFGTQLLGLCDVDVPATAQVTYRLPYRVMGSLRWAPTGDLREASLEALGGITGWSAYDQVAITINVDPDGVLLTRPEDRQATAALLGQHDVIARGLRDTWWAGGDARARVSDIWIVGVRGLFDHHAIPTEMLSPNSFDTDTLLATGFAQVHVMPHVDLGFSFTHSVLQPRATTHSAYWATLDTSAQAPEGYRFPHTNGRYAGRIDRGGLALRGAW